MMQKLIVFILFLNSSLVNLALANEFEYDKNALSTEFSELDKISAYVEENNITYTQLSTNPEFKGVALTNVISVKPNLTFDEVDWGSFAWGFCCWPVGIFTVLINDNKDKNSKDSFWAGVGTIAIAGSVSYIGIYTFLIAAWGGF